MNRSGTGATGRLDLGRLAVRGSAPPRVPVAAARLGPVLAAALALAGCGGGSPRPATSPDVTVLFGRAVNLVRATKRPSFARAVALEADGITAGGRPTTSAAGIVKWRFVFDNQSSHSRFRSAMINYGPAPKQFGAVVGNVAPFLEDIQLARPPRMTLSQAVRRLRGAGYQKSFSTVTLRNPLGPERLHPLYIFGIGHMFVGVDTVTQKVARIS